MFSNNNYSDKIRLVWGTAKIFSICAGCGNLPLAEGAKPPTTLVRVKSYAKSSDSDPLQDELFKTEVIEVSMYKSNSCMAILMLLFLQCNLQYYYLIVEWLPKCMCM